MTKQADPTQAVDPVQQAITWVTHLCDGAKELGIEHIPIYETILAALQSRTVDVETVKKEYWDLFRMDDNEDEVAKLVKTTIEETIDHLASQGYLSQPPASQPSAGAVNNVRRTLAKRKHISLIPTKSRIAFYFASPEEMNDAYEAIAALMTMTSGHLASSAGGGGVSEMTENKFCLYCRNDVVVLRCPSVVCPKCRRAGWLASRKIPAKSTAGDVDET